MWEVQKARDLVFCGPVLRLGAQRQIKATGHMRIQYARWKERLKTVTAFDSKMKQTRLLYVHIVIGVPGLAVETRCACLLAFLSFPG